MPVPAAVQRALSVGKEEVHLGDACGAGNGCPVQYSVKGGTREGAAWLFPSRLGIVFKDGAPPVALEFKELSGLERVQRVNLRGCTSFAKLPDYGKEQTLVLTTQQGAITTEHVVKVAGAHGLAMGRAIDFLWRYVDNRLSAREAVCLACSSLRDVVSAVVCLPIPSFPAVQLVNGKPIEGDFEVSSLGEAGPVLTFRSRGGAVTYRLDDVTSMVVVQRSGVTLQGGATLVLRVRAGGSLTEAAFRASKEAGKLFNELQRVWAVNCNSLVTLQVHDAIEGRGTADTVEGASLAAVGPRPSLILGDQSTYDEVVLIPDDACLDLDQVLILLTSFQNIDRDGDGLICEAEFMRSLGPAVKQQVGKAVFRVFDVSGDGAISFAEYLFGHRILRMGTQQDRVRFFYRIFDVGRNGSVTLEHFEQILTLLRTIATATQMAVPTKFNGGYPTPFGAWCRSLFNALDGNKDGMVKLSEFARAVQHDEEVRKAIAWAFEPEGGGGREGEDDLAAAARRKAAKKLVSFGQPQWLLATSILAGIQLAVDHRTALAKPNKKKRKASMFKRGASTLKRSFREVAKPDAVTRAKPDEVWSEKIYDAQKNRVVWRLSTGQMIGDALPPCSKPPDVRGECTPANCEVYFVDYCPQVFDDITESIGIQPEVYLQSLGITQLQGAMLSGAMTSLVSVMTSSQSGSFFFLSHDNRFLLKTIPKVEYETFCKILRDYHRHLQMYPKSLLSRILGLHSLQFGDKHIIFIVMENVLHSPKKIDIQYDLKGSEIGRKTHPEKKHLGMALKDVDLKDDRPDGVISMPPEAIEQLHEMLLVDSVLLRDRNIIDYSVLIGIHRIGGDEEEDGAKVRSAKGYDVDASDPLRSYQGGCRSSDGSEVYYLGIIDILTNYGLNKIAERSSKAIRYANNPDGMSCVGPNKYQDRFIKAMRATFRPQTESPRPTPPTHVAPPPVPTSPSASPLPSRLRKSRAGDSVSPGLAPAGPSKPTEGPPRESPPRAVQNVSFSPSLVQLEAETPVASRGKSAAETPLAEPGSPDLSDTPSSPASPFSPIAGVIRTRTTDPVGHHPRSSFAAPDATFRSVPACESRDVTPVTSTLTTNHDSPPPAQPARRVSVATPTKQHTAPQPLSPLPAPEVALPSHQPRAAAHAWAPPGYDYAVTCSPAAAPAVAAQPLVCNVVREPHEAWGSVLVAENGEGVWVVESKPGTAFARSGVPPGILAHLNGRPVTAGDCGWVLPEFTAMTARGERRATLGVRPMARPPPAAARESHVARVLAEALPGYEVVEDPLTEAPRTRVPEALPLRQAAATPLPTPKGVPAAAPYPAARSPPRAARAGEDTVDGAAEANGQWGWQHASQGFTVRRAEGERWGVDIRRSKGALAVAATRPGGPFARAAVPSGRVAALNGRAVAPGDDAWFLRELQALQDSPAQYLSIEVHAPRATPPPRQRAVPAGTYVPQGAADLLARNNAWSYSPTAAPHHMWRGH